MPLPLWTGGLKADVKNIMVQKWGIAKLCSLVSHLYFPEKREKRTWVNNN